MVCVRLPMDCRRNFHIDDNLRIMWVSSSCDSDSRANLFPTKFSKITMKLLLLNLAILLTALTAQAATVSLAWDANPTNQQITKYTVYELTGTTWTKLQDAITTIADLANVVPGVHRYAVTATNILGESGRSNEVETPSAATPPANTRIITISVTVE